MNKENLIEYLKAICDGENAIYACNEAILAINEEIHKIALGAAVVPIKPKRETVGLGYVDYWAGGGGGVIVGAILGGMIGWQIGDANNDNLAIFLWSIPIGALLGLLLRIWWTWFSATADKEEKQKREDEKYIREYSRYQVEMETYLRTHEAEEATKKRLTDMAEARQQDVNRIWADVWRLYSRNILHENFRNIVAVNQIREYLEMGVCDTLEGPNGAYAVYLQDVRTSRICESIGDLKTSVLQAVSQITFQQGQLIREIRTTNNNISDLRSSIQQGVNEIRWQLSSVQSSVDQTAAYLQTTSGKLDQMQHMLTASAHNQYIMLREANVRNYLLRNPHFS